MSTSEPGAGQRRFFAPAKPSLFSPKLSTEYLRPGITRDHVANVIRLDRSARNCDKVFMFRSRFALGTACVAAFLVSVALAASPGTKPVGKDGQPLNLDFETGDLRDWKAEGKAFEGQPIKGDTVFPRRNDMRSNHQGNYWIGGFEKVGDDPKGTLTSATFKVTRPWASFLVAGGPWPATRVELVDAGTQMAFFKVSGFHAERPKFDNELDPANSVAEAPPADVVPFAGLSPQEAS